VTVVAESERAPAYPLAADEARVEAILARMTLAQKVGQMLMVGVPGTGMETVARRRVSELQVGGIIYLERNLSGAQQVAQFSQALQAAALEATGLPLFIGWNHEGGPVMRHEAQMTAFPSAMALGSANDPQLAYEVARAMGAEMRSLGVNMSFAPVLDVNSEPANPVIGLRAFGEDPALVADLGQQTIAGLQDAGVIAVAKHFPGHGAADVDSHEDLPLLDATVEQLYTRDLLPFWTAIEANVGGVMVAHLQIPALEPDGWAASLSPRIVTAILRQQMGFDGVVMTDDMGMGAIAEHYVLEEAAVQAVLAGNDLLLAVEAERDTERMHAALLRAVEEGRIPLQRIDEAVRRILRLKLAYNLDERQGTLLLENQDAHWELAARAGRAAVRILRDDAGWLPLPADVQRVLIVSPSTLHEGTVANDGLSLLGELLAARGIGVQELFYFPNAAWSVAETQGEALAIAPAVDAVVVLTWNAILRQAHEGDTAQETLVGALLASGQSRGQPVIVVFSQLPYDAQRLPEAPAQVAMYGDMAGQVEGLVTLLLYGSSE
jgi:beta-N-acetylhexosaminidase